MYTVKSVSDRRRAPVRSLVAVLAAGAALCLGACTFDTAGLEPPANNASCGNGVLETGETCDGGDLGGQTCAGLGFESGVLGCGAGCAGFDTSNCTGEGPVCGDGEIEGAEVCDGTNLDGQTCVTRGFDAGELACAAGCATFDTSDCTGSGPVCGDGEINGDETCDGTNLDGQTCVTRGFVSGTLQCAGDCAAFVTDACLGQFCGNDVLEGTETCDGTDLGGETCATQGFFSGQLACGIGCAAFDLSDCTLCGNAFIDPGELCDGTLGVFGTCEELGCRSGEVACNADCTGVTNAGCYTGHDEDADGVDDNCDACPTWHEDVQADGDHDGLGDVCESPAGSTVLTRFVTFEPFTSNTGNWSASGGSWNWGADHVVGEDTIGGNYYHNLQMTVSTLGVEATFYHPEPGSLMSNYTSVVFGVQHNGLGNTQSAGWACSFKRNSSELVLFKYGTTGWSSQTTAAVSTSAVDGQWRKLRGVASTAGIRCYYLDEAGTSVNVTYTDNEGVTAASGKVGLRTYNEKAVFTSFITYQ